MRHGFLGAFALGGLAAGSVHAFDFAPYESIAIDSRTEVVAIGDVTGDGRNDIVAATTDLYGATANYQVLIYAVGDDGTLGTPVRLPTGAPYGSISIELADLDLDGTSEILIGHGNGITLHRTNGDGSYSSSAIALPVDADYLAHTDVDRDGLPDIIALDWSTGAVIAFGDQTLGFSRQQLLATNAAGWNDLDAGDVNSDGIADVVVMSGQSYAVPNYSVHLHDGIGSLLPPDTYWLGEYELAGGLAIGDFNNDGRNDLAIARDRNSPTHLWIHHQDEAGGFSTTPSTIASYDIPSTLVARDIDGNGLTDIAVVHDGWQRLGVYLQDANGLGAERLFPIPYGNGSSPKNLALGEVDGDNCTDAVVAVTQLGFALLRGTGCVTPPPPPTVNLAVTIGASGDSIGFGVANIGGNASAEDVTAVVTLTPARNAVKLLSWPVQCTLRSSLAPWTFSCGLGAIAQGSSQELAFRVKANNVTVHVSGDAATTSTDTDSSNNTAARSVHF